MRKYRAGKDKKKIGETGEDLAVHYLISQNYDILFRNFYSAYGEIDIIALRGDELVFVEVKTRSSRIDDALSSVSKEKQRKLRQTAGLFYQKFPEYEDLLSRFDLIAVILGKKGQIYSIQHFDNAFSY